MHGKTGVNSTPNTPAETPAHHVSLDQTRQKPPVSKTLCVKVNLKSSVKKYILVLAIFHGTNI